MNNPLKLSRQDRSRINKAAWKSIQDMVQKEHLRVTSEMIAKAEAVLNSGGDIELDRLIQSYESGDVNE